MKKHNASGLKFDIDNFKAQIKQHVEETRAVKKGYTIEKAMKKAGLRECTYFAMISRGTMSKTSKKNLEKLKVGDGNVVVKVLDA